MSRESIGVLVKRMTVKVPKTTHGISPPTRGIRQSIDARKRCPTSEDAMLTFEAFLADYRQTMLGTYFVAQAYGRPPRIALRWPKSDSDDGAYENLVWEMADLMPSDTLISDLRDWDLHLYDLMADDWFFGAAFGPESEVEDIADQLAVVFMEQVEKLELDYDQFSDTEGFRDLVDQHALQFVKDWRKRLFAAGSGQLTKRSVSGG